MSVTLEHPVRAKTRRVIAAVAAAAALAFSGSAVAAADESPSPQNSIPLTITNDSGLGGVYIYILGTNLVTGQMGYTDAAGNFHGWPHVGEVPVSAPDASAIFVPDGQSQTIRLPKLSGRVYYSYNQKLDFKIVLDGKLVQPAVQNDSDPNRNKLFNWTEYTLNDAGLWINSTQVDFFSAPYQVGVRQADGNILSTGRLKDNGYSQFFNALGNQPGWGGLIQRDGAGNILRALAPGHAIEGGHIAQNIMQPYVDRIWEKYRGQDITITPFDHEPNTKFYGRVQGDRWVFRNGGGQEVASFSKPSAGSIFGCAGDLFAPNDHVVGPIARTLCAGFIRTTLDNPAQPHNVTADFYKDSHTNFYAKYVHEAMANGKAYAFAFDDVGANESLVHDGNPQAAFIKLDPINGHATPIGNDGGNNGGGNNGGGNNGGGSTGTLPAGTGTIVAGGLCLDVPWGNSASGTKLQVVNCNGNVAQNFERHSDGTITIFGKCVDAAANGNTNGTAVQLWDCNGTAAQKWHQNGTTLRSSQGLCLDATDLTDGSLVHLWSCHGGNNQNWTLNGSAGLPTGSGKIKAGEFCLDVPWGNPTSGVQMQIQGCHDHEAQNWTRHADGTIRAYGKCLDIAGNNQSNGTNVQLWDCNGNNAQKWTYDAGTKALKSTNGLCLDAWDPLHAGAKTQLWACHGGANQQWSF